jgi:hypothetical protein
MWIFVLNIMKGKVTRLLEYPPSEEPIASIFKVEEVSPTGVAATAIIIVIIIIIM